MLLDHLIELLSHVRNQVEFDDLFRDRSLASVDRCEMLKESILCLIRMISRF